MTDLNEFRIDIPKADLDEVAERLARTRFAQELPGVESGYGVTVAYVKRLVNHWRDGYDWRAWEARLNAYPQFTTVIDGQKVHFVHVRSGQHGALPLILTHGWPGTVVEYLDVIEPLTAAGFDLVIPSVPGFGFSGPTTEPGWNRYRVARAWVELMRRLGYQRYGAVGNDIGSFVAPEVGRTDPEQVVGVHVTQLFSLPTGDPAELVDLSEEDQAAVAHATWFWDNLGGYNLMHAQQPQTVAHALADSPAGLVGWNGQLFGDSVDDEFALTNIAIYWFTGTAASAMRIYREDAKAAPPAEPTTVPIGLAQFAGDFQSIRRFAERDHRNIVSWHTYERGGHYASRMATDLLVDDIRGFFGALG